MLARRFRIVSLSSFCVSLAVASGCARGPRVEGEVALVERDAYRPFLVIRMFPDHPDGFDPRRMYTDEDEFASEVVPVEDVDFPYAYRLELLEEPQPAGARWRVLAWLADDPHEEWIHPGQTFGTQSFEFVHVPHGSSFAEGVFVQLAFKAPAP